MITKSLNTLFFLFFLGYAGYVVSANTPTESTEDKESMGGDALTGNSEAGEARYNQSCINCHGAAGKGVASYPKVSGQDISYTTSKLETYRDTLTSS